VEDDIFATILQKEYDAHKILTLVWSGESESTSFPHFLKGWASVPLLSDEGFLTFWIFYYVTKYFDVALHCLDLCYHFTVKFLTETFSCIMAGLRACLPTLH